VVELVIGAGAARTIIRRIEDPVLDLHAPHLLDIEVTSVVRRYVIEGKLAADRGRGAIENLAALDIERHGHDALLPRIWELRCNLTAYDAAYVALAEALDAPLLTRDRRLAAAPTHLARVLLV